MQQAVNELWMYTGELFIANETDGAMGAFGVELEKIKPMWMERVRDVLIEATLDIPQDAWMQQGGRAGRHSEHLGYVLAELQFMQRAYPGMEW
jgi:ring-1,2-phenylacetyl-CoA epoxidase subunit PaaC